VTKPARALWTRRDWPNQVKHKLNFDAQAMPSRTASRTASRDAEKINLERQNFREQLSTAINEEDDPLAVYNQFVQWTVKNYGENDPDSGLLELLEQATREFKEDPVYKTDLRYLKIWSLYARQVERSAGIDIYAYLLSNEIGISYSVLYEEYAALLEADGRCVKMIPNREL
jgi:checkpoint serine/threonine-protein kinase